jgi:hypothetical protein
MMLVLLLAIKELPKVIEGFWQDEKKNMTDTGNKKSSWHILLEFQ